MRDHVSFPGLFVESPAKRLRSRRSFLVSCLLTGLAAGCRGEGDHTVADAAALKRALATACPGDHIVLASGTYAGNFTLNASGTAGEPIVIRSATTPRGGRSGGAELTGRLTLAGDHGTVYGLRKTGDRILVTGNRCGVYRCWFRDSSNADAIRIMGSAREAEIAYNEIRDYGAKARTGRAISIWSANGKMPQRTHIHHNHIIDHVNPEGSGAAIGIGSAAGDIKRASHSLIEYNLVENNRSSTCLGIKSSYATYRFNTVKNCAGPGQTRFGSHTDWIANAFIRSAGVITYGPNNRLIGNYVEDQAKTGAWLDMGFPVGTVTIDEYGGSDIPQYPQNVDCLAAGNVGRLRIGGGGSAERYDRLPTNCRVEAHRGPLILAPERHVGTIEIRVASLEVPAYIVLDRSDVGPGAAPLAEEETLLQRFGGSAELTRPS